jgi:hypothetical protein
VDRECSRRRVCAGLPVFLLFCLPYAARGAQEAKVDYHQVRAPILSFEKLIGEIIKTTLPGDFGLVQKPKGAFVPDSGYNFMFLVNVDRGLIHSPMGTFVNPDSTTPEMKKKKIELLKGMLVQLLYSQGSTLPLLRKDKAVTIVAFFEEFTPEEGNVNKTLIISVLKSDIDESVSKKLSLEEFKNRVKIVDY